MLRKKTALNTLLNAITGNSKYQDVNAIPCISLFLEVSSNVHLARKTVKNKKKRDGKIKMLIIYRFSHLTIFSNNKIHENLSEESELQQIVFTCRIR